jgi:hypothetical protein
MASKTKNPIDKKIVALGDWRAKTLCQIRDLIKQADPDVIEECNGSSQTIPPVCLFGLTTEFSVPASPINRK